MAAGSKTATYWNAESVSYLPRTLNYIAYIYGLSDKANRQKRVALNMTTFLAAILYKCLLSNDYVGEVRGIQIVPSPISVLCGLYNWHYKIKKLIERSEKWSSYTSVFPKMVPTAAQLTQVKSEASDVIHVQNAMCISC